jgi:hypothetical protein
VQVIRESLWLKKGKEVQSFLGFTDFYHRFVTEYSDMAVPLARLTLEDALWHWLPACDKALGFLEQAFTSAPICTVSTQYSRRSTKLTPLTTPSWYTVGTNRRRCLSMAFYSRARIGAELNYDPHDKGLLAIFEAFKKWPHYLDVAEIFITHVFAKHRGFRR